MDNDTQHLNDKIWIELDSPRDADHARQMCEKATRMAQRLGITDSKYWWSESRRVYCFGGDHGYYELPERGHWLNLDFLGREV